MERIKEKMRLFHENPVISWHEHIWYEDDDLTKISDRSYKHFENMQILGFDRMVISRPIVTDSHCSPDNFIAANELVKKFVSEFYDKTYAAVFVNPGFAKESVQEIERRVNGDGFVAAKLMHQYFVDDPTVFPIVEKCIDLDIPLIIHQGHSVDKETLTCQPRLSDGAHIANLAKRYPEATLVMAHIGGGGDWQWSLKAIADCPNVFADIGGSVYDRNLVEEAYQCMGSDRLLFGTDGMYSSCVGKMLGAKIPEEDKKKILSGAVFEKFLERRG